MNIQEIRVKYPEYNDLSDEQLAQGLYNKFYSDMDYSDFSQKIGLNTPKIKPLTDEQKAKPRNTDYLGIIGAGLEGFGEGIEAGTNRAINAASLGAYDWLNRKFLGDQYGKQQRELEQRAESAGAGGLNTLANLLTDIGAGGATTGNVAYNLAGKAGLKGLGQLIGAGALEGSAWGATGSDTLEQAATNIPVGAITGGVVSGGLGAIGNAIKRFSPELSSVGLKSGLENALTDNETVKALKRGAMDEDIANQLLARESEVKNALNTRSADTLEELTGQRIDVSGAKQANRQAYRDYFADNANKSVNGKNITDAINTTTEFQKKSLSKAISEANDMTNSKQGTLKHTNEVKKALNDMIDSSMTQSSNMQMKPTAKTNQLMELKTKLDDLLRKNSEIKNLDTEYSRLAKLDEAYQQGFKATPRSDVKLANDEQKTAFLKGATDNILADVKTDSDLSRAIMNKQNVLNKAMSEKEYRELMSNVAENSSQYDRLRDILNRARITTNRYSNLESPANLRELGDSRLSAALYGIGKLANSIYGASNKKIAQRIIDGLPIDEQSLLLEVLARANPAATGSFINQEILGRE